VFGQLSGSMHSKELPLKEWRMVPSWACTDSQKEVESSLEGGEFSEHPLVYKMP